jgi:hypothetical protein
MASIDASVLPSLTRKAYERPLPSVIAPSADRVAALAPRPLMRGAFRRLAGDQTWSGCTSAEPDAHRTATYPGPADTTEAIRTARDAISVRCTSGKARLAMNSEIVNPMPDNVQSRAPSARTTPRGVPPAATSPQGTSPRRTPLAFRTPARQTLLMRVRSRQRPSRFEGSECGRPRGQIE